MKTFAFFSNFFVRMRYPVSLPEEIAEALGIRLSNENSFDEFLRQLLCPSCRPTKLVKFMPREKAENLFKKATVKEKFKHSTLVSYQFPEGSVAFVLQFDEQSRLRRIYLRHKQIKQDNGIEISLDHQLSA